MPPVSSGSRAGTATAAGWRASATSWSGRSGWGRRRGGGGRAGHEADERAPGARIDPPAAPDGRGRARAPRPASRRSPGGAAGGRRGLRPGAEAPGSGARGPRGGARRRRGPIRVGEAASRRAPAQARRAVAELHRIQKPLQRLLASISDTWSCAGIGSTPADPQRLIAEASATVDFLRRLERDPPPPVLGVSLDAGDAAADLEGARERLQEVLDLLTAAESDVAFARERAASAIAHAESVGPWVAQAIEGLAGLAEVGSVGGLVGKRG